MAPFNTENIDIEYKQEYVEDIRKEIIPAVSHPGIKYSNPFPASQP